MPPSVNLKASRICGALQQGIHNSEIWFEFHIDLVRNGIAQVHGEN